MKASTAFFAFAIPIFFVPFSISAEERSIDIRKAAEQGEAHAQFTLGSMYFQGHGVPQDYEKAAKWFLMAAEQGNGFAQKLMGRLYNEGDGVPQDYSRAYMWFNLAASKGDENAKSMRDLLLEIMSPDQIDEGQSMTRKWLEDFEKKSEMDSSR